jgi:hypothetical protein
MCIPVFSLLTAVSVVPVSDQVSHPCVISVHRTPSATSATTPYLSSASDGWHQMRRPQWSSGEVRPQQLALRGASLCVACLFSWAAVPPFRRHMLPWVRNVGQSSVLHWGTVVPNFPPMGLFNRNLYTHATYPAYFDPEGGRSMYLRNVDSIAHIHTTWRPISRTNINNERQ